MEELITELGTDVDSSWNFVDGDLQLISNDDNICQSIANRLNSNHGCFDLYYNEYGSFLQNFLGWQKNDETLSYIKTEIEESLKQDVRFSNVDVTLEALSNGKVKGIINILYTDNTDLSLSMVLDEDGADLEVETDGD